MADVFEPVAGVCPRCRREASEAFVCATCGLRLRAGMWGLQPEADERDRAWRTEHRDEAAAWDREHPVAPPAPRSEPAPPRVVSEPAPVPSYGEITARVESAYAESPLVGGVYRVRFDDDAIVCTATFGRELTIALRGVVGIEVGGRSSMDCWTRVRTEAGEVTFVSSGLDPAFLRARLGALVGRLEDERIRRAVAADAVGVVDRLAALGQMLAAGQLTRPEFEALKAELLDSR